MLIDAIERYLSLRQTLGYKLKLPSRHLRAFARFADAKGEKHVRTVTAIAWSATAPTRDGRHRRLNDVARLGRFLQSEDPNHEVPPTSIFAAPRTRPMPYIYSSEDIDRILEMAGRLRRSRHTPHRPQTYVMMLGLIAATGLRVSEALNLRLDDILADGILNIRQTKFNKSRLVPLHESVFSTLQRYLVLRCRSTGTNAYLFPSANEKAIPYNTMHGAFAYIIGQIGIAPQRVRRPRIHDLRHSFATRVLEQCAGERSAVDRQVVALATYMGHTNIAHTYWYLQATPQLMSDIAVAAEALFAGEVA